MDPNILDLNLLNVYFSSGGNISEHIYTKSHWITIYLVAQYGSFIFTSRMIKLVYIICSEYFTDLPTLIYKT